MIVVNRDGAQHHYERVGGELGPNARLALPIAEYLLEGNSGSE